MNKFYFIMKCAVVAISLFQGLPAKAQLTGNERGGPIPYQEEQLSSAATPDVPGAREACLAGTSPQAKSALKVASQLAADDCKNNRGYSHISPSRRGNVYVIQPRHDGVPSFDCEAHARIECWN